MNKNISSDSLNIENSGVNSRVDCGRKIELMDYLYQEAPVSARASFEQHLDACDSCTSDLGVFNRVRDEMSAWQVGFAPRAEVVLPRRKMDVLRELINLFPAWARGVALTGAAAALVLFAISLVPLLVPKTRVQPTTTPTAQANLTASAVSSDQVEKLVEQAVAKERERIAQDYSAQLANFKQQLAAEREVKLQAINAQHDSKLQAVKASLRDEIRRSNLQASSFRGFFDPGEYQDPWSAGR